MEGLQASASYFTYLIYYSKHRHLQALAHSRSHCACLLSLIVDQFIIDAWLASWAISSLPSDLVSIRVGIIPLPSAVTTAPWSDLGTVFCISSSLSLLVYSCFAHSCRDLRNETYSEGEMISPASPPPSASGHLSSSFSTSFDGRRHPRLKEGQFVYKHGRRHHSYDSEKAPYPLSYDRQVLEL